MSDKRRARPYVWASWITKLIAGEDKCWYRAWYKAHHSYEKTPDDPQRADFFKEWTEKHDRITAREAERLKKAGLLVRVEDDAAFKLAGKGGDVAAKPDLVGVGNGYAVVIDAKAGRRRESDVWQVLLYMFGLRLTWLAGIPIRGEVAYHDEVVDVGALTTERRDAITSAIRKVVSDALSAPRPSAQECRFCDVAACEYRQRDAEGDATGFF